MEMGDKGKFGLEKKDLDPTNFHSSNMSSSDWRFEEANLTTEPLGLVPTEKSNNTPCKGDLMMGSSASSASGSLADSFCPILWDHHLPNSSQQLGGFCDTNVPTSTTSTSNPLLIRKGFPITSRAGGIAKALDMGWNPLNSMSRGGAFFLQTGAPAGIPLQSHLSQFPADSAFIERAARFSCFNGGNFSDMVNPFSSISESMNPYSSKGVVAPIQGSQEVLHGPGLKPLLGHQSKKNELNDIAETAKEISMLIEQGTTDGSLIKNDKEKGSSAGTPDEAKQDTAAACSNESDDAEFSGSGGQVELSVLGNAGGEPPAKVLSTKKRKRTGQNAELDQTKGASQSLSEPVKGDKTREMVDQNAASATGKAAGKQGKDGSQASDVPKEEYIHVRARRGQATNSHSLAERVRREKISERMKFLQDLVPGCSKVTGKAVMLDEIINYVQSLQRQVEFLSMKLATVNPTLDFNIEGLLAKEILQSRGGPSTMGFSPDMAMGHHQLHSSQQGLIQAGVSSMGNPSEALRSSINSQLNPMNSGYKELPPQLHNAWDDELHNVIQMNFGANAPYNSQDLNGSLPPGHMKVEL